MYVTVTVLTSGWDFFVVCWFSSSECSKYSIVLCLIIAIAIAIAWHEPRMTMIVLFIDYW